jgi:Tol biopolymer transport system component
MWAPSMSDDGRYVAITTSVPFVESDTNHDPYQSWLHGMDVYVFDRIAHTVSLATVGPDGTASGGAWGPPSISGDGSVVAFQIAGQATTLVSPSVNAMFVFARDRVAGTTTQVFSAPAQFPVLSENGRYIVASVLDPVDPDQLVVHDLVTGTEDRVDVTDDEQPAQAGTEAYFTFTPAISNDGRYVAFKSAAWNLIPGMTGPGSGGYAEYAHVYVRDRVAGTTTMVAPTSVSPFSPVGMSDDGATVGISRLEGQGTTYDVAAGTDAPFGFPLSDISSSSRIETARALSGDGRFVVFISEVAPYADVYIQRIQ